MRFWSRFVPHLPALCSPSVPRPRACGGFPFPSRVSLHKSYSDSHEQKIAGTYDLRARGIGDRDLPSDGNGRHKPCCREDVPQLQGGKNRQGEVWRHPEVREGQGSLPMEGFEGCPKSGIGAYSHSDTHSDTDAHASRPCGI